MNAKILVVGANGQLGSEIRRQLEGESRVEWKIPSMYAQVQADYVDIDELDISNWEVVRAWFRDYGPYDVVVNCAAMTNVDGCEADEAAALRANAIGPWNLARACAGIMATDQDDSAVVFPSKLVHVSTDYVFPGTQPGDRNEDDPVSPISAYGRSKLAGELLAASANPATFIVRTAWLHGRGGRNFVETMLRLARECGRISVVNDQFGNPTFADDVARCILGLAATEEYGVYHCTGEGTCSWFDLASAAVDMAGIPCQKEALSTAEYRGRFPASAPRPAYSSLDCSKLQKVLGYRPAPWQDALRRYLENRINF